VSADGVRRVRVADPGAQVPSYDAALCDALAQRGLEVRLATAPLLAYAPPTVPDGVARDARFGRLLARWPEAAARRPARRLLRAAGYPGEWLALARAAQPGDAVHLQWSLWPEVERLAARALARRGVPLVLTVHNVLPHERRPWHAPRLVPLYRAAHGLIVHSEAARDRMRRLSPRLATAPTAVVPMAPLPLPATTADRAEARRRLGLPGGVPLALCFGHVRPYKGVPDLLAAWPAVAAEVPGAALLVAGAVAGGARAVAVLQGACRAVGATLRPGIAAPEDAGDLMVAADVVVLPYRAVDDSAVLQAARGHGRAVVAAGVGGLPEALALGGGLTVPPRDPGALAAALASVLGDPRSARALEAGARKAAAAWTWTDVAVRTAAAYDAAAARLAFERRAR